MRDCMAWSSPTSSPSTGPHGSTIQHSIYDADRDRIVELLRLGVSARRISTHHLKYGSASSLNYYIKTRQLPAKHYPQVRIAGAFGGELDRLEFSFMIFNIVFANEMTLFHRKFSSLPSIFTLFPPTSPTKKMWVMLSSYRRSHNEACHSSSINRVTPCCTFVK